MVDEIKKPSARTGKKRKKRYNIHMKVLVVYYSRSGNTKKVAEAISNAFKCDIEEIKDTKDRSGFLGWLYAGRDSMRGNLTKIKDILKNVGSYDIVIVGGPIWAWNIDIPVRTFLTNYGDQIKNAAFFCTEDRMGASRAFKTMSSILGKEPVATLVARKMEVKQGKHLQKVSAFVDKIRI